MLFSARKLRGGSVVLGFGLGVMALAGCGGGGDDRSPTTVPATGRLTLSVQWPERTRLIPKAANCLGVLVQRDGSFLKEVLLPRPDGGGTSSTVLSDLPLGAVTVTVFAYPEVHGTGVVQARTTFPASVTRQDGPAIALSASPTIDHLDLHTPGSLQVGQGATLAATAKDATGQIVITDVGTFTWSSSDPTVVSVIGDVDQALTPGTTIITGTETESGKTVSATITVVAVPPVVRPPKPPGDE